MATSNEGGLQLVEETLDGKREGLSVDFKRNETVRLPKLCDIDDGSRQVRIVISKACVEQSCL
jgi:hypothetical protein